jgi:lipoprotein-releasing system permease protein
MVSGAALALRGAASKSVVLQGIDPERYRRIVRIEDDIVAGQFRVIGTEAVIGIELAHDLGVIVGDKVRLAAADNRSDVITVAGIFDIGNKDLNRRWVLVSTKLAQNLLDLPGGVSSIDLSVQEVFEAESIARGIASRHPLLVESWMATNSQLLAALRNQTMTNRIIRAFVILIVALGIASVLVVSVVQKQKEIGILRAMGVSGARVMRIFLIQGAMVGLLGSLLGSLLGILMLWMSEKYIVNGDGSPLYVMQLDGPTFFTACLVAVVTGVLAAALPARSAARLDPVAAIRG